VLGLAAPIGVAAACAARALLALVQLTTWLFYSQLWPLLAHVGRIALVAILLLGASLYAPLTRLVTPQTRAHGLPEVIYAVRVRGGRMRLSSLLIDLVSAAINIGAGGSVGRKGR
jgi:CIC family chloride channel protein